VRQQVLPPQLVQQVLPGVGAIAELVGAQHDVEALALQHQAGFLHPARGLHIADASVTQLGGGDAAHHRVAVHQQRAGQMDVAVDQAQALGRDSMVGEDPGKAGECHAARHGASHGYRPRGDAT